MPTLDRSWFHCILYFVWMLVGEGLHGGETIGYWEFSKGMDSWTVNPQIRNLQHGATGVSMELQAPDPFLTSPQMACPAGKVVCITVRMLSRAGSVGQIYFRQPFSEERSRTFVIQNDGQWHEYRVWLPTLAPRARFRLDPSFDEGLIELAWIRIEAFDEMPGELWAQPRELRNKKFIGGGLYTVNGAETAITPQFIAEHPEFNAHYPFDGIVLPAVLSREWVDSLGLTKLGMPLRPAFFHELLWNTVKIPDEAVAHTLADLQRMRRGNLTDNFLIFGMVDGARGLHTPNLADDHDWESIQHNAALAARLCRLGKLKGLWLDTEQYGQYRWRTQSGTPEFESDRPQGLPFPLGKDAPEVLRRRGKQWIQAIQAEFPEVKIMTTFAWSPDSNSYGPLGGVIPFLDGVLEGIQSPAEIIHGHENTFYFGHAPGTTHTYATKDGFPGDRNRYSTARAEIRNWRSLSNDPAKYDAFVKVGMAAWVEDHPWNTPPGWPNGTKASLWSNLPLALVASDEYVWVWCEHTKYGQPDRIEVNPFLASLSNQTWNTPKSTVSTFDEPFDTDPLARGWYFDFDMLSIGRKAAPEDEAAIMDPSTAPYGWDKRTKCLKIAGESSRKLIHERRRYVRAVDPTDTCKAFTFAVDFHIQSFGDNQRNPMIIGFFQSDLPLDEHSFTLRISSPEKVELVLAAQGKVHRFPVVQHDSLRPETPYRFELTYNPSKKQIQANLMTQSSPQQRFTIESAVTEAMLPWTLDELGIAIDEHGETSQQVYRFQIDSIHFIP